MINIIFEWLNHVLAQDIYLALVAAFLWGILSVLLSPCHLASLPLIIGYINRNGISSIRSAFINSVLFAIGILITIAVIGLITGMLGGLIGDIGTAGNYIVSLVFFAAGAYMLGLFKADWNFLSGNNVKSKGYLAALFIGIIFGAGLGPCTFAFMAPVLGIVFQISSVSLLNAVLLILAFGAGHCLVLAAAGTTSAKIGSYLKWADNSYSLNIFKKICGILIILGGIYFIYSAF